MKEFLTGMMLEVLEENSCLNEIVYDNKEISIDKDKRSFLGPLDLVCISHFIIALVK